MLTLIGMLVKGEFIVDYLLFFVDEIGINLFTTIFDVFFPCSSWGTDESEFFKILVNSPSEHLKAINAAYVDKYGYSMTKAAEKETGGDTEDALLFLIGIKLEDKTAATLAKGIKSTTKGIGTDETGLMNYIIRLSVFPELFREVMSTHEEMYEKTVEDRIDGETDGDFHDILMKLVEVSKEE